MADDAVNVNCVASWRARADAQGRVESLFVDLHNSWRFDSNKWNGQADALGRLLQALQRNERGRLRTTNRVDRLHLAAQASPPKTQY